jgi:putative transposase
MANIAYKYRLKPNKSQQKLLSQMAGSTRWLWNHMLDLNKKQYAIDKKFLFAYDMHAMLPALKNANSWLKDIPSQSLQQKCTDLDRALKSVWKSGFGFPQFKSKSRSQDSFRIPQTNGHIKISDSHIQLPKIGMIRWYYHRPITGTVKSVTITRDINHWYISVICEIADVTPIIDIDKSKTVGIDLGISAFATLSNGDKISSPNFLKRRLRHLKRQQRQLAKKTKGSKNRQRAADRVAKIHRDIRNQRADWLHKTSKELVEKYHVICVEDLKIRELLQKKQLSRAIADQGWGIFTGMLAYKAKLHGKHLTRIGTYMPSTKTCSSCGSIRKMKLSDRVYMCENHLCTDYLKTKDRDLNAALNIHFWGLTATPNINLYTPGTGGINACGDTSADVSNQYQVSVKQEAACPLGLR